ncbi:MAG: hypothetical protein GY842_07010 [bacterium]|nr:hypothetical protein [bacterium]
MDPPASFITRIAGSKLGVGLIAGALAVNLILAASSAARKSVTVDEFALLPNGVALLKAGAFNIDCGVPPLAKMLFALPVVACTQAKLDTEAASAQGSGFRCGRQFVTENRADYHKIFLTGRSVSIVVLLGTCLLSWGFARRLYGGGGALVTVVFVCLSPNLLAHGRLVTTDIYLTGAVVGVLWAFDGLLRNPVWWRALGCGLPLGAAVLCKFTGVLLFVFLPMGALGMCFWRSSRFIEDDRSVVLQRRTLGWGVVSLVVAIAVINLGYGCRGTFMPLGDYAFSATMFQNVQRVLPGWLPLPLPYYLVLGCDTQLAQQGYDAYLLGEFSQTGFGHYYLVGLLVKTPVPLLVLTVLALAVRPRFMLREVPMLTVGVLLFAFMSWGSHKNIGVRYLLFGVPIVCIWIGRLAAKPLGCGRVVAGALVCGVVWMLAAALTIWPNYLAYFNVPSGGPACGHRYLLDSNLDWGQDLIALGEYMEDEGIDSVDLAYFGRVPPSVYGIEHRDLLGVASQRYAVVSANFLWGRMYFLNGTMNLLRDRDTYAAFRDKEPEAVLGHTLYVFDMKKQ